MTKRILSLSAVALAAAALAGVATTAPAAPFAGAPAIGIAAQNNAAHSDVTAVRWGRGGFGWGIGAGILGGAIIGGALAAPYYGYGPYYPAAPYTVQARIRRPPMGPAPMRRPVTAPALDRWPGLRLWRLPVGPAAGYGPGPAGYGPGPGGYAPGGPAGADAVAICARRYRSYDPSSGTFLGNDGQRHPCP